jgi:spermidine/putrescine transport system ATP-binding protein
VNGFVASFVGENNIFSGSVQNPAGGMASFETPLGTFRARLGEQAVGKGVKLFVRPEHTMITDTAQAENSVAITISEVSFEGNFIAVYGESADGARLAAEIRNDGSATVPAVGSKAFMSFDAARAAILPDADTRG